MKGCFSDALSAEVKWALARQYWASSGIVIGGNHQDATASAHESKSAGFSGSVLSGLLESLGISAITKTMKHYSMYSSTEIPFVCGMFCFHHEKNGVGRREGQRDCLCYQETKNFTVFSDPGNIPFPIVQANSQLGTSFHILYVKAPHNLTGEADQKSLQTQASSLWL